MNSIDWQTVQIHESRLPCVASEKFNLQIKLMTDVSVLISSIKCTTWGLVTTRSSISNAWRGVNIIPYWTSSVCEYVGYLRLLPVVIEVITCLHCTVWLESLDVKLQWVEREYKTRTLLHLLWSWNRLSLLLSAIFFISRKSDFNRKVDLSRKSDFS